MDADRLPDPVDCPTCHGASTVDPDPDCPTCGGEGQIAPVSAAVSPAEPPTGVELIAAERQRQIDAEGWTAEHDDSHDRGELALAAACYAIPDAEAGEPVLFPTRSLLDGSTIPPLWPWLRSWYERTPYDRKRELVKAGALIAAEIDRLQRERRDGR